MKPYVPITKLQHSCYKATAIFNVYVYFLHIYGRFYVTATLFPFWSRLDYFKANLTISNIMSFHWRHFKCHVRDLLHLPWNSVLFVKLWL